MSTALIAPRTSGPATRKIEQVKPADPTRTAASASSAEISRWVLFLGIPFVVSAAFFGAAIGTGITWFMAAAFGLGPELMIVGYIYLSLTSDSNSEYPVSSPDGGSVSH